MTIGRIVLPVFDTRLLEFKLDCALSIAAKFKSKIDVVFLPGLTDPATVAGDAILTDAARQIAELNWDAKMPTEDAIGSLLNGWAVARGISVQSGKLQGAPSCHFLVVYGNPSSALLAHARASDLIIAGQPGAGITSQEQVLNRLVLMESGRPVIIVASEGPPPEDIFGQVLLAWDGSLQVSRTVALATPLLQAATRLLVCTWATPGEATARAESDPILDCLRYNGMAPASRADASGSSRIGGPLLARAREEKATLICMGAYSEPRAVQALIGGNTRHLYHHSHIPILLSA